ncbi:hypothetical protein PHMEG_0004565 [Phytophthora megakarya]|uniref:Uncharacterized protein n=1 Tax=Phytophthora megakarya TaxID=4795 RepID=A0A225WVS3_9STRA|nr:hypothetical protein PHMEG_0004565 [Phytophthora megakarya]
MLWRWTKTADRIKIWKPSVAGPWLLGIAGVAQPMDVSVMKEL